MENMNVLETKKQCVGNKEKFSSAFGRLVENSVINSFGHFLKHYDVTESRKKRKGEQGNGISSTH
jgi:hypothetical protein